MTDDQRGESSSSNPGNGLLSESEWRLLHGLYSSTTAAGYGSVKNLQEASGLTRKKVLEYLHTSSTYTKFKSRRRKFTRLKVLSPGINDIWSVDLAHVDKLASDNGGVRYILIAVDVLSRFTRVSPMKNKTAATTLEAFQEIISRSRGVKPKKCWVDDGTEFLREFKDFCLYNNIHIYSTFSETKSMLAERYIRSLKNIIYKYMEEKQKYRYVDQLQNFAKIMNARVNRTTMLAPADVRAEHTEYLVSLALPPGPSNTDNNRTRRRRRRRFRTKFRVGESVRIALKEMQFSKGYKQQYTTETFKVARVVLPSARQALTTYILRDVKGESILGRFYPQELVHYRYNDSNKRARHQTVLS